MAKFQKGRSGNPSGKKPGILNKRTQLTRQFEVHAEALINKTVELALEGDVTALKLCIERLVPKANDKLTVTMPDAASIETTKIIPGVLMSLANQEVSITDLKLLLDTLEKHDADIDSQFKKEEKLELNTKDPIEAARVYQQIMMRN